MDKIITASDLRDIVAHAITGTIEIHRGSKKSVDSYDHVIPTGPPSEEEIDYFLYHNPYIEPDTLVELINPGYLGYSFKRANVDENWIKCTAPFFLV